MLGGSGFVGSHVCREALDRGLTVASLSRYRTLNIFINIFCLCCQWFLSRWMQLIVPADANDILDMTGLLVY